MKKTNQPIPEPGGPPVVHRRAWTKRLVGLGVFLGACAVCLAAAELATRLLWKPAVRGLLFTSPAFVRDDEGAVRYARRARIRTAAVYDGTIEYDVTFETNDLGFVDGTDYRGALGEGYVFVGDSFTAGFHGGEPWVSALRREVHGLGVNVFNLGVSGTGPESFRALLASVRDEIPISTIVIVGISDDLGRPLWYPIEDGTGIRFCPAGTAIERCAERPYIAGIIDRDATAMEIRETAELAARQQGPFHVRRSGALLRRSRLLVFAARALSSVRQPDLAGSLAALEGIRRDFPDAELHFIHLPQVEEVSRNRYLVDVRSAVERAGYTYHAALDDRPWTEDMFLPRDRHPNAKGSENIRNYVRESLFAR